MNIEVRYTSGNVFHMGKSLGSRIVSCEFIGSFFSTADLPRDPRPQIAFAGRSNVGKSSLLNTLVGQKRMAKVSSTPGKTRSVNFFLINNSYYLVDLPGYGYASVSKSIRESWRRLLEGYLTESRFLIGLVLLLDCRRELTEDDEMLISWLQERSLPVLVVVTKTDKLNRDKVNRKVKAVRDQLGVEVIAFSSVTGAGKKELLRSIHDLVNEYKRESKG